MTDPNRWQPLALAQIVAQNGLPIPGNVQRFVGPHWGHVTPFALPAFGRRHADRPRRRRRTWRRDEAFKQTAVEIIRV